jgi:superfamily II DNA or RNA helicase
MSLMDEAKPWGILELDLVKPPSRFWADVPSAGKHVEQHVDAARVTRVSTPAQLLAEQPAGEGWTASSRRALRRLEAWFLVLEDPQRRLEARSVDTLAHQASMVRHVVESPHLERVLIADEVGLGKTIEAGLIVKQLFGTRPQRVLYLAPAQLVRNVHTEFQRLELASFRKWVAGTDANAQLDDQHIIASIHRATHPAHMKKLETSGPWDILIVDECHHLTDWGTGGGKPGKKYQLVEKLIGQLSPGGRLILLSGTPHQGHRERFKNLLKLLRRKDEGEGAEAGRVIYRTKDDVRDWDGNPLFPERKLNPVTVIDLGERHRAWLRHIHEFYSPPQSAARQARKRAAGWRCAQALQWASSSIHAGLGYLVRQAIRAGWTLDQAPLGAALGAVRPYRDGLPDEPIDLLYARIRAEIVRQEESGDLEDIEDLEGLREEDDDQDDRWKPDPGALAALLSEGVVLLKERGDEKWQLLWDKLLADVGEEKVVLFAQPVETVTALRTYLRRRTGRDPAIIIGDQKPDMRQRQVEDFWKPDGPQFLISSRAGGEGLNLQCARRLVHVDVPWNPMELEQRVGRIHRIGSRRTILVDMLVVKDSREEHAYSVARRKLQEIASSLGPERFEMLFARVMSVVPPAELTELLGESAMSPLSDEEQQKIADLVTKGFAEWKLFHEKYREQQLTTKLDAGQAGWEDVRRFCESHLDARPAVGFTSLRFRFADGEVSSTEHAAPVLEIDGSCYACGDYAGCQSSRRPAPRPRSLASTCRSSHASSAMRRFLQCPRGRRTCAGETRILLHPSLLRSGSFSWRARRSVSRETRRPRVAPASMLT